MQFNFNTYEYWLLLDNSMSYAGKYEYVEY